MEPSDSNDRNHNPKGSFSEGNSIHLENEVKTQGAIDEPTSPDYGDNGNVCISACDKKRTKCSPREEQCSEIMVTKLRDAKTTKTPPVCKKSSRKSGKKVEKVPQKLGSKRYALRSSHLRVRLLRSMSKEKHAKEKNEKSSVPVSSTADKEIKRKKRKKKVKKAPSNEFSLIRKRVRYMLTRMSYEQNFIEAYSGEGWKGQSLDKLKPEKELERAKSEILRCKLRIREQFQQLDSLLTEGKFQESLFDSDGEIDSEDIFCAKCGLKDFSVDNDIILCDGICDRGFHQNCLNPPLLTEDIPVGDEGWLCPACDCKVDCLELLTDSLGIDILIEDTWESVFPEAAAIANGDNLCNNLDYPTDDSEDDDFNPDIPAVDTEGEKADYSSDESDSTSLSEESAPSNDKANFDISALPSDDSDDDDFDPDRSDPNEDIVKEGSISNESDFTSDSDDFCAELSKNAKEQVDDCDEERNLANNSSIKSSVSGKRQREPLNFKNLHDDAYGKESSDSSDDEDWSENAATKKIRKNNSELTSSVTSKAEASTTRNGKIRSKKPKFSDTLEKENIDLLQSSQTNGNTKRTPDKTITPDENKGMSARRLGASVVQKLIEVFKEDQYPNRETKKRLAEELGITAKQIDKWFINTRHHVKVSVKVAERLGITENSSSKKGKRVQIPKNAQAADQLGTPLNVSAKEIDAKVLVKEADQAGATVDVCTEAKHSENETTDKTVSNKNRRSFANRTTTKNIASNTVSGRIEVNVAVDENRQKGTEVNVAVDENRQKAIARELRKRRNIR